LILITADIPNHWESYEDILGIYRRCSSFRAKWKHEWPSHNSLEQIVTHSLKDQLGILELSTDGSSKWSNRISEYRIRKECGQMLSAPRAANKQVQQNQEK
jgi:hypothetical protein